MLCCCRLNLPCRHKNVETYKGNGLGFGPFQFTCSTQLLKTSAKIHRCCLIPASVQMISLKVCPIKHSFCLLPQFKLFSMLLACKGCAVSFLRNSRLYGHVALAEVQNVSSLLKAITSKTQNGHESEHKTTIAHSF